MAASATHRLPIVGRSLPGVIVLGCQVQPQESPEQHTRVSGHGVERHHHRAHGDPHPAERYREMIVGIPHAPQGAEDDEPYAR